MEDAGGQDGVRLAGAAADGLLGPGDRVDASGDAPAGYAADFGVTGDGRTLLVEINDGYSLGCYGLQHNLYAQLLSARWAELVGTEDECNFS